MISNDVLMRPFIPSLHVAQDYLVNKRGWRGVVSDARSKLSVGSFRHLVVPVIDTAVAIVRVIIRSRTAVSLSHFFLFLSEFHVSTLQTCHFFHMLGFGMFNPFLKYVCSIIPPVPLRTSFQNLDISLPRQHLR